MEYIEAAFLAFMALTALEALGRVLFWPVVYRIGPRVLTERLSYRDNGVPWTEDAETENGRLRIRGDRVLMHRRWRPFAWQTTLELTGNLRLEGGECLVEVRVPLTSAIFMAVWLLGWTVGTISALANGQRDWFVPSVIGYLGFAAIAWTSLVSEWRRMSLIVREYLGARLTSASS